MFISFKYVEGLVLLWMGAQRHLNAKLATPAYITILKPNSILLLGIMIFLLAPSS